jgi:hypothetical protein
LALSDGLWNRISKQFPAFVGLTAFEEPCRERVLIHARAQQLPLALEIVGSHWAADGQVGVVALNWRARAILPGAGKWSADPALQSVVRESPRLHGLRPRQWGRCWWIWRHRTQT